MYPWNLLPFTQVARCSALAFSEPHAACFLPTAGASAQARPRGYEHTLHHVEARGRLLARRLQAPAHQPEVPAPAGTPGPCHAALPRLSRFLDVECSARGASAHGLRLSSGSGRRGDPEQVAEDVHGQRGQRQRRELNDRPRLARQAHRPARAIGCARPARAGRTPTTDRLIDDAVPHKPNTARLSCGAGQSRGMQCGLSVLFRAPPLSQCGAAPARNRSPLPFTRECAAPEKR